jgi:hypothetical protein
MHTHTVACMQTLLSTCHSSALHAPVNNIFTTVHGNDSLIDHSFMLHGQCIAVAYASEVKQTNSPQ